MLREVESETQGHACAIREQMQDRLKNEESAVHYLMFLFDAVEEQENTNSATTSSTNSTDHAQMITDILKEFKSFHIDQDSESSTGDDNENISNARAIVTQLISSEMILGLSSKNTQTFM